MSVKAGREIRYGRLLVDALDFFRAPLPSKLAVARVKRLGILKPVSSPVDLVSVTSQVGCNVGLAFKLAIKQVANHQKSDLICNSPCLCTSECSTVGTHRLGCEQESPVGLDLSQRHA